MSSPPGQHSNAALAATFGRRKTPDEPREPDVEQSRYMDCDFAVNERQTLIGALERVADRQPALSIPEALHSDLRADVPSVLRSHVLAMLSSGALAAATETCTAVVRLMAVQPSRRWLDGRLILRVALKVHERSAADVAHLSCVRELMGARNRWLTAAARQGRTIDARATKDAELVEELTALPMTFPPALRSAMAGGLIRQDILGAREDVTTYALAHAMPALEARRLLNQHAPTLSSLFGTELTPTRLKPRQGDTATPTRDWTTGLAMVLLVVCGAAALLIAQPSAARQQGMEVQKICQITGDVHTGCLTAASLASNVERGECGAARVALDRLEEHLSGFGLNREFAVIRADELGEFRQPFDGLQAAYEARCY